MELTGVIDTLRAWEEQERLQDQAFAAFEQWLESASGPIRTFSRPEIEVTFHNQSLVFRSARSTPDVVATCLALSVYDGECPLGTFKLLTDARGRRCGIEVELGSEVAVECFHGHVWWFYE